MSRVLTWTCLAALGIAPVLHAQDSAANPDIGKLIAQLDDNDYEVREAAGRALLERWEDPVVRARLQTVMEKGSAEARARAGRILPCVEMCQSLGAYAVHAFGLPKVTEFAGADQETRKSLLSGLADLAPKGARYSPPWRAVWRALGVAAFGEVPAKDEISYINELDCTELGAFGPACAATFLDDPDPEVRLDALWVVSHGNANENVTGILPLLKDPDSRLRATAVQALERHTKDCVPEIAPLLKDPDAGVRKCAVSALGNLQKEGCAADIVPLLKDSNAAVRLVVVETLWYVHAKERVRDIVPLLDDPDATVRERAIEVLCALDPKGTIVEIVPAHEGLGGEDRQTFSAWLDWWYFHREKHPTDPAVALKDPGLELWWHVVDRVRPANAKTCVPVVIPLLKSADPDVRRSAIEALGRMEARDHAAEIVPLLRDAEMKVRRDAALVLGWLGAREHAAEVARGLDASDPDEVAACIEALGALGADGCTDRLLGFLADTRTCEEIEWNVGSGAYKCRASSLSAIAGSVLAGWIEMKARGAAVVPKLKSPSPSERRDALAELGRLDARARVPDILPLLEDPEAKVRADAVFMLGELGARDHSGEIARQLTDSDAVTRSWAAHALGRIGATDHVAEIVSLLDDTNANVVAEGMQALASLHADACAERVARFWGDTRRCQLVDWNVKKGEYKWREATTLSALAEQVLAAWGFVARVHVKEK